MRPRKWRLISGILAAVLVVAVFGAAEANPNGTVKIAQIIHPTTAHLYADDVALFNWLADYDTNVTQIKILDMAGKSTDYWIQFDVVILAGGCGAVSIANLVSSEVPIIAMSTGHADELELGTGVGTLHQNTREFHVRDNSHPITDELSLGAWTWSKSGSPWLWVDGTNNAGSEGTATVLVDNGEVGKDILIVHKTKKYAFFGWYRASQWPDEGWSLMEKTIEWAIDRSLLPFSMEFTVEITDPDTIYKPGETIHIVVYTGKAGYTVTGSFSNLYPAQGHPKMAGVSYNADTWQYPDVEYWMDTYLGSLGYTVEKIAQQTVETHSSEEWEAYDVVFISEGFASSHDLTNLIDSNVPIIMTGNDDDYVLQAGLGDGYEREDKQTFYVIDNTHPITQGLTLGEWSFASSMWTTRIGTSGCDVTVLIDDNDSPAKAYLATRQDPKRVWFGYYRGTQAGAEARGIFSNSVAWTLGKDSLPSIKADAVDNGDGTYSMSYTIGDTPLVGTYTIPITVEDQVGHTATNDSLSVTIPAPLVKMASFVIDHAKLDFKKKPDDDKVRVQGKLELDTLNGNGVDISEDVTVTVGPLSETITMVAKGKKGDKWEYKRLKDGAGDIKHMTIDWKNGKFDIRMDKADLSEMTDPENVTISVQIGDDVGSESITMRVKKHHWDYKAKNGPKAVETEPFAITDELKVVAYPNPIRDVDTATFQVMGTLAAQVEEIQVQIYDLSGRLVWEKEEAGSELDWHIEDLSGRYLANGIYLYSVQLRIGGNWINQDIGKIAVLR